MMEFEKQCLVEEGDLQSYWFASDPGLWWGTSHNSCDVCDPNYRRVLVRNTDSILGMISSCRRAERQLDFFFFFQGPSSKVISHMYLYFTKNSFYTEFVEYVEMRVRN